MNGYERICDELDLDPSLPSQTTLCPAHDDTRDSLSVSEGRDGQALVFCHAGCETALVVKEMGLEWTDLFGDVDRVPVATYTYRTKDGEPHIYVTRYSPKGFSQVGADGTSVKDMPVRFPYRLPELFAAPEDQTVYITEGEKDADNMAKAYGVVATSFMGGAGKWRAEYAWWFANRPVVIVADNDDPGRAGADVVATQLRKVATSVRVVVAAHGKDSTDHILAGFGIDDFQEEGGDLDEFGPMDWDTYQAGSTEWILEPYVPRAGRALWFGKAGSLKSLLAMWLASHVAKDGGRAAYFALEMLPDTTARRLRQLSPPKDRFICFTKDFRIGSTSHLEKLVRGLRNYDLIVIDSWTAARAGMKDSNEQIAQLDTEFFLPLIKHTGAAVLVIDNTGHDMQTKDGPISMDHARGASAKGDKMDVTTLFSRPEKDNNYLTEISVQKMRLHYPAPKPIWVSTPQDRIEFYITDHDGRPREPLWPGLRVVPDDGDPTPIEQVAEAALRDRFGGVR